MDNARFKSFQCALLGCIYRVWVGYTHHFTDFLHRVLFLVVQVDGDSAFRGVQGFWAATSAAPGACRGKSSLRTFADKIAFELGQCAEYVKDEFARTRCRVDGLVETL